jgi:hypothetical protein
MAEPERKDQRAADRTQPDKNVAAQERPVPSQAEGDLDTVEEDLNAQEKKTKQGGSGQ